MTRVLVVEDDENKRSQVLTLMATRFPSFEVLTAASLMSGVRAAKAQQPDLVLLDMTLPNYDLSDGETGGGMHAFGGVEFLKQARRLRLNTRVLVVTQFETFGQPPNVKDLPELDAEMRANFGPMYRGSVYYHASIEDWSEALAEMIKAELPSGGEHENPAS